MFEKYGLDWSRIEEELFVADLPVLAVIGNPPREPPEYADDYLLTDEGLVGTVHEYDGVEIVQYVPNNWRLKQDGSIEMGYCGDSEFFITVPSDAYERVHVVNPMSDELDDTLLMERSGARLTPA